MAKGPDSGSPDMARVASSFARFATDYPDLPLYQAISAHVAKDDETASLLLAAPPGQERPVLWLAALHDLVLRRPELPAAKWYPSVVGPHAVPRGDPWPDVRQTVLDHRAELTAVIASRTIQTNEVNRSVYIAAAVCRAARDVPERAVVLVELGASAGLLLMLDRYRVELIRGAGSEVLGDAGSTVRCAGTDRTAAPVALGPLPRVAGRVGVDLHPAHHDDTSAMRWLEACLWPDVPGRVERFRAAVSLARGHAPTVRRGDLVDALPTVTEQAVSTVANPHLVVFNSWALTYVARARRPAVADVLARFGADGMPVTWVTAEPPGCAPGLPRPALPSASGGPTVLGMRRWRGGRESRPVVLGSCHPHGAWLALTPA